MIEEKKWGDLIGDHRKARHFPNEMEELEKENPESIKVRKETASYVSQLISSLQDPYIPALRFQEFLSQPGWEEKTLAEIAGIKRGNGLSKSSIIKDGKNSCILYGELFTKYNTIINSVFSKTNETSTVTSKAGDILMPTSDVTPKGLAKASVISVDGVLLGGDMNIISPNSEAINSIFLAYSINYFSKKIIDKVSGSTVKHIYVSDLKDIPYEFPSLPEQQKIAEFFSALDECIELTADKVKLLKEQKQGYLKKIFNREFVFTDDNGKTYPEWEEKKLGEFSSIKTGKLDANAQVENGRYRFYTCAREYSMIDTYSFDTEALLVSGNGANVGYVHYYHGKFDAYQRTYVIQILDEYTKYVRYYLDFALPKRIHQDKNSGNMPYIVLDTLALMSIRLPAFPEQQKIAEFFSALDEQIELNENKLALLKEQKKGYLQGVFG